MNVAARYINLRPRVAASVWPTPAQLSLLRAALWTGDEARAAWAQWQRVEDLRGLDLASWNLLPLAWSNLAALGVTDAVLDECRGYYRYHWARNQVRLRRAREHVRAWQERGMPVVVLKGMALVAGCYHDAGVRPMADLDLLVPGARVQEAASWLLAAGWRPAGDYREWTEATATTQASFNWARGDDQIDLHWHVLHRSLRPEITREFWARIRPLQLGGLDTRQLGPEDALLHACSHGVHYAPDPAIRWFADAAWILRRAGADFDWDRVTAMAALTGSALALRHGLDYAAAELRLPVPPAVLAGLRARRATWRERVDYRGTAGDRTGGRWARAWRLAGLLWRAGGRGRPLTRARRMANFLRTRWEADSLRQVARLLVKKMLTGQRGTVATDAADGKS
jgi:Uncharacterised nucleotidyltransferase